MSRLIEVLKNENLPSYLTLLFWQHGESDTVLREEIRQMHENGIGSFIVESRPHPGFFKKEGKNKLQILVTNTLAKKFGHNIFDRAMPQEPSGLMGPVRVVKVD